MSEVVNRRGRGLEDVEDHFGRAIESDGEVAAAGASGGVAEEGTHLPWAVEESGGDARHTDEVASPWQADLAPVGMSTELEVEACMSGLGCGLGAVAEEDAENGFGWAGLAGGGDVGATEEVGIIHAGECDGGTARRLEGAGFIEEDRKALLFEPCAKGSGVMIAQNRVGREGALGEGFDNVLEGGEGVAVVGKGAIPEIAGNDGQVALDVAEKAADRVGEGGIEVDMEIGKLENAEAVEIGGQVGMEVVNGTKNGV